MIFVFVWLPSLNMVLSMPVHVAAGSIFSFFLWMSNIPLYCVYVCVYHIFLIHSSVEGGFHVLAIVNNAADGSDGKASACIVGNLGSIPGSGKFPWRRKWQPTLVLLPGKSHGRSSLVGYSPCGRKELDMTEWLHFNFLSNITAMHIGLQVSFWTIVSSR